MLAEVISIGDELTSGLRLDTNSQWISQQLGDLGVRVLCHTTLADDEPAISQAFAIAAQRASIVVITGGLGPTADDLTRQALARFAGVPLVLHEPSLAHITQLFAKRNRPMPESNRVQALFPQGSQVIPNLHGTAPGIHLTHSTAGKTADFFCLPGVPAEMKELWAASVVPALKALGAGTKLVRHYRIKCFGVGESHLEQMLPDLIRRGREPPVGITVSDATITLSVATMGTSDADCRQQAEPTLATIRECLGSLVFGTDTDELEDAVLRLLAEQGQTLSTCELGTQGLLNFWLQRSAVGAEADIYRGGVLWNWPGVDREFPEYASRLVTLAEATSAAGRTVVGNWCNFFREQQQTDWALVLAHPPAMEGHGNPRAWAAVCNQTSFWVRSYDTAGHPALRKIWLAKRALNLVRLALCKVDDLTL